MFRVSNSVTNTLIGCLCSLYSLCHFVFFVAIDAYVPYVAFVICLCSLCFSPIDSCRWWTTKLPTRFGSMCRTRVQALHVTTADVQREVEQHSSSNIWPHVDPM
jgi:hypothetical protein